jgi:hypothetical protein
MVRPIWARLQNNALSVHTALIDTIYTEVPDLSLAVDQEQESYPNPFSDQTYYAFKLHHQSLVNLDVVDLFGHKVAGIISNQWLDAGKYIRQFDPSTNDLPSGVYYFRLRTGDKVQHRKIIYLR